MNARTLDQLKKQHITNRQPQRGLDGSNNLVKSFVSQVGGGWINGRMPDDSELQHTYENCGEYIFIVAIPNPNKRHMKANNRPLVVREAFVCFNMDKDKYEWHICDDVSLNWTVISDVVAWQPMPQAPIFASFNNKGL